MNFFVIPRETIRRAKPNDLKGQLWPTGPRWPALRDSIPPNIPLELEIFLAILALLILEVSLTWFLVLGIPITVDLLGVSAVCLWHLPDGVPAFGPGLTPLSGDCDGPHRRIWGPIKEKWRAYLNATILSVRFGSQKESEFKLAETLNKWWLLTPINAFLTGVISQDDDTQQQHDKGILKPYIMCLTTLKWSIFATLYIC